VATGDPIKFGVLQDKSGVVSFSSTNAVAALQAASQGINNGEFFWASSIMKNAKPGIMGRPIQFIYEDTQANPNLALLATQKLAGLGVSAIIGTTSSPDAIQAKVACQQAKVPCIFPTLSAAAIVAPPNNDYSYTMTPNFDVQAQELVKALQAAKKKNITIVQDDSGTAKTVATSFTKAFAAASFPVASTEVIPASSQDVTSQVERVKSKNPDAILDMVIPATLNVLFVKQLKAAGVTSSVYGINTLLDPQISAQMGASLDKAVAMDLWDHGNKEVQSFVNLFHKINGENAKLIHTHIYMTTALLLLKATIEKANSTDGATINPVLQSTTNFPAGFGQLGYTVNWKPTDHNGASAGGIVFVVYQGTELKTWPVYQPSAKS
jgi:branched-chain amino acid transport system substrate-binding protein